MKKQKIRSIQSVSIPLFMGSRSRFDFPMSSIVMGGNLLVEKEQYDEYKKRYAGFYNIIVLPESNMGFSYMMNQMLENAPEYFMFSDDDILGFEEYTEKGNNKCLLDNIFNEGVEIMKKNGYSQLGIGFKGHNFYRIKDGIRVYEKNEIHENLPSWGMFIAKTADLKAVGGYNQQLALFSDYEMSARLVTSGYKIARWNKYMFDHKMKSFSGGAADLYKKSEKIDSSIDIIKAKYPIDSFKVIEMHGQREIRFNFKKLVKSK